MREILFRFLFHDSHSFCFQTKDRWCPVKHGLSALLSILAFRLTCHSHLCVFVCGISIYHVVHPKTFHGLFSHIAQVSENLPPEVFIIKRRPLNVSKYPVKATCFRLTSASISINSPDSTFLLPSTDTQFCSLNLVSSSFVSKK